MTKEIKDTVDTAITQESNDDISQFKVNFESRIDKLNELIEKLEIKISEKIEDAKEAQIYQSI